jgi:hypothetical protein
MRTFSEPSATQTILVSSVNPLRNRLKAIVSPKKPNQPIEQTIMRMIRNGWMAVVIGLFVTMTSPLTLSFGQEQEASEVDDLRRQVADLRRQISEIRSELDDLRKAFGAAQPSAVPMQAPDRGDIKPIKFANRRWKVEVYRTDNIPLFLVEILADQNGRVILGGKAIGTWFQDNNKGDVTIHTNQLSDRWNGTWTLLPVNANPTTFEGSFKSPKNEEAKCRFIAL